MESRLLLVCSVFDAGASEHGPLFFAPTLTVMWRNVEHIMESVKTAHGEFFVFVHGEFGPFEHGVALQPYLEPVVYHVADRTVASKAGLEQFVVSLRAPV